MSDYYAPPEVNAVVGLVDTFILWKNENQPPRGFERYHPSAFGQCLRKMQYQRYSERGYIETPKEDPPAWMCRIWGNGHDMHDRWRGYFTELGVLRGVWKCQNPNCRAVFGKDALQGCFKPDKCDCGYDFFKYDEVAVHSDELNFHGHADIILDFSRFDPQKYLSVKQFYMMEHLPRGLVVADMKSINHFDFQDVAKGNPHDYYLTQLMIYTNILDCEYGILIYENKNNQRTCSFKVERNADTHFVRVKRQAREMNEMVEVVDEEGNVHHLLPPPRPKSREDKNCERCLYREMCHNSPIWDDPELEQKRYEFYEEIGGGAGREVQGGRTLPVLNHT
jgi:hypothetical protein